MKLSVGVTDAYGPTAAGSAPFEIVPGLQLFYVAT